MGELGPLEVEGACLICGQVALQRWSFRDELAELAWVTCGDCARTAIVCRGRVEHPVHLAGRPVPPTTLGGVIRSVEEIRQWLAQRLEGSGLVGSDPRRQVERLDLFLVQLRLYAAPAHGRPVPHLPARSPDVEASQSSETTSSQGQGGSWMERGVLDLAVGDQQAAEARIEDLRRQIAEEEQRIVAITSFIETYRSYEGRLSSQGTEAHNHAGPDEGSPW